MFSKPRLKYSFLKIIINILKMKTKTKILRNWDFIFSSFTHTHTHTHIWMDMIYSDMVTFICCWDNLFELSCHETWVTTKHYPFMDMQDSMTFWHPFCDILNLFVITLCKVKWDRQSFLKQWGNPNCSGHGMLLLLL